MCFATLGKGAEFLADLTRWTLVTAGNSASLTAAVEGGGHIDALGGGKEGCDGDDGGWELHFGLIYKC